MMIEMPVLNDSGNNNNNVPSNALGTATLGNDPGIAPSSGDAGNKAPSTYGNAPGIYG
jgi:hypothetical protein